ncbi:hypothetical protein JVU11DRAFT_7891 [Chiua virens]|nr:hypothetical protein JVU11DRAFT_7891 [Chiua virens]
MPLTPTLPDKSIDTPREVILTPRATPKPMKRKVTSRSKRAATKVKSEPPEIDLSKVRPPSPSDDPLLLSGTPSMRSPPLRARFTPVFPSSPTDAARIAPPVSFAARLSGVGAYEDSPDTEVHALPVFDAPRAVTEMSDAWSDSDDDELNLTGEYTGKYKILKVPTKAGPARKRMDSWGRPVSPFPYSEMMERSLPLPEDGGKFEDILDVTPDEESDLWEVATEPPHSDVEPSSPTSVSEDEFAHLDDDFPLFDVDSESTQVLSLIQSGQAPPQSDRTILEEEEEEEEEDRIDRELSVPINDGPRVSTRPIAADDPMEDSSSDEGDNVEGEDIIKITSDDPKAAARAAAILRMHDYDCILAAEKKKRSSRSRRKRRKTIENAGISKSYVESRSQRWQTLQGCESSPGSRSLPLLEIWREAEDSVFLEHNSISYCDASFTLSPLKAATTCPPPPEPLIPPLGEWTRDCWKCLDKCLVAERLAVAAAHDLGINVLADMGDISKDVVLDRFANQLGGESVLVGLGPEWSRDNLMLRLDVLIKKQSRTTRRAPPVARKFGTTELRYRGLLEEAMGLSGTLERCPTSSSVSSDNTVVSGQHDVGKMVLGDLEPSWLTSHTWGPIRTPSRTPDLRLPHPKDQVHLRHASLELKSMIPVSIRPKRLVDLRHHSPMKADRSGRPTAGLSGGASVRELVKQFETWDR